MISNIVINDIDLYRETVKSWDLELLKLDRGSFKAELQHIRIGPVYLAHTNFNSHLDQRGQTPVGLRSFAIPADNEQNYFWRGQQMVGNKIGIWPPDGELEALSKNGFNVYALSLSHDYIAEVSSKLGLPLLDDLLKGKESLMLPDKFMRALRSSLKQFLQQDDANDYMKNVEFSPTKDAYNLTRTLLLAIAHSHRDNKRPSLRLRDEAVKRATDYIFTHAQEAPSIADICGAAYVSERTLHYAFLDRYDVTPYRYLKSYRLNATRKELNNTNPASIKIKEVAKRWGFWHMGKFSADYRQEFGELPSETLRSKK